MTYLIFANEDTALARSGAGFVAEATPKEKRPQGHPLGAPISELTLMAFSLVRIPVAASPFASAFSVCFNHISGEGRAGEGKC